MIKYQKILVGLASLSLIVSGTQPAQAFFTIKGTTNGQVSIFAQGGLLDYDPINNPYFMLGIEPKSDGVYLTQGNSRPFNDFNHPSNRTRLLKINGFGQMQRVGPVLKSGMNALWGNSLTTGPGNKLYTVTNKGIWGFDPQGGPTERYSQWQGILAAAGLSFEDNGNRALVSSDYAGLVYFDRGAIQPGERLVPAVSPTDNPNETLVFDDHFRRNDGLYVIGDVPRAIGRYTSKNRLRTVYDLKDDPDLADLVKGSGNGARGIQDPISGDIFFGLSFYRELPLKYYIARIKSDFSDATLFATDMEQIRDMKFGPSTLKYGQNSISLYVAINDRKTFQGRIYEIPMGKTSQSKQKMSESFLQAEATKIPEPPTILGMLLGLSLLVLKTKFFRGKTSNL